MCAVDPHGAGGHLRHALGVAPQGLAMQSLLDHLRARLEREGAMTVADYMGEALTHPTSGYYMHGDPFGAPGPKGGDFVTAPEISQMFGELIGVWCADTWLRLGDRKSTRLNSSH